MATLRSWWGYRPTLAGARRDWRVPRNPRGATRPQARQATSLANRLVPSVLELVIPVVRSASFAGHQGLVVGEPDRFGNIEYRSPPTTGRSGVGGPGSGRVARRLWPGRTGRRSSSLLV